MEKLKKPVIFISVLIITLLPITSLFASQIFKFNFKKGQKFRIEAYTTEDIYKNDLFIKNSKSKTIGILEIIDFDGKKALHRGVYRNFIYNKSYDSYEIVSEYKTEFYRDVYGHYQIDKKYYMPVVRDVPVFPDRPIDIGDQWTSKAYEVHDFRKSFGIDGPVILPAAAAFQYLGDKKYKDTIISRFSINYVINYTMKYTEQVSRILPYRIIGYFNQLFIWNQKTNLPDSYKENFDFILIMNNGETIEYVGKSHGNVTVTNPKQQKSAVDEEISSIKKKLSKNMPTVNVTRSNEGIIINVGEILFKFDSDELTKEADVDLDNIVKVLKDYSDRRIRIIGHTDSTGTEDYNLSLSLRRARRIAKEIIRRAPYLKDKISYIGMGEKMPIASNSTEEGRKKNRRVEIIILNK